LSGNFNASTFHSKFNSGKLRENDRQSHGSINIATAPVHKQNVANMPYNDSNHIINRFINNNNTQAYNNHYSLSLNRHENHNAKLVGVGLVSPYFGNGIEEIRGTKSDVGMPLDKLKWMQRSNQNGSISHKSILSLNMRDANIDNFNNNSSPMTSAITFSNTGSKLLYTNKHRLDSSHSKRTYEIAQSMSSNDLNANKLGPLLFKNDDESENGTSWKNSVYDNPIRSVS